MSEVSARLNLGLRAKDAPGKKPGSGCGCGRHQQAGEKKGCGCGGHRQGGVQQPMNQHRDEAAAQAAKLAAELGVFLPDNPAAATDLEA